MTRQGVFTVRKYVEAIRYSVAAGDKPIRGPFSELDILNHAGEWLFGVHGWRWLERRSSTLALVAGQDWAALPDDLSQLIAVARTSSLTDVLEPVSFQQMLYLRNNSIPSPSWAYYYAITHQAPVLADGTADPRGGPTEARLELYPAPQAAEPAGLTVFFRGKWAALGGNDTFIPVMPTYMQAPLLETCRAYAGGYLEERVEPLDSRLARVASGAVLEMARRADLSLQLDHGPVDAGPARSMPGQFGWDSFPHLGPVGSMP